MVKVLPTAFTLFESQNIFNAPAEPLCVHSTEQYVFIACEGCLIEAHDLSTSTKIARLRTIHPVSEMVYNKHGDCIVSLERRSSDSSATARIYFKWRAIRQLEQPTRVISMDSPRTASRREGAEPIMDVDAEILELPMDNVSCLAVCDLTGSIAIGSDKNIRIFTLKHTNSPESSLTSCGYKIITYMDIITDMTLKKICICANYLACISTHRVRVLKIQILTSQESQDQPWTRFQNDSYPIKRDPPPPPPKGVEDSEYFLNWSPAVIWEMEAKEMSRSLSAKMERRKISTRRNSSESTPVLVPSLSSSFQSISAHDSSSDGLEHRSPPRTLIEEREGGEEREEEREREETKSKTPSKTKVVTETELKLPTVATITLPAITRSSKANRRDTAKHELEILGPVEYIWGQPLSLVLHREAGPETKSWVLTMLYKRLPSSGFAYVHVSSNESKSGSGLNQETGGSGQEGKRRATVSGADLNPKPKTKGGIHSVQLVPTFTGEGTEAKLVGMSCIFANRAKGYIYDVFTKTKLVTSLAFMTRCHTVSYDGQFLHALSTDSESVDSYTCRISASVLANKSFVSGHIQPLGPNWMKQPCPSTSMELTLISSNKFLGCMSLTSSLNHVLVFCKDTSSDSFTSPERQSFLQSLSSLRRPKVTSSVAWNVYVLKKGSITDMFSQFCDSAKTLGMGAPPVLQHHLSEAHLLLRNLVIGDKATSDVTHKLSENCFELADSYCLHSSDKNTIKNAAGYFVLSGRPISEVIRHVRKNYSEAPTTVPFNILLAYLNLVLFDDGNKVEHIQELRLLANEVVEMFAKYNPERLGDLVLFSWLEGYSKERILEVCTLILSNPALEIKTQHITNMAILYTLCELDRLQKASQVLRNIPDDYLLSWATTNTRFLLDSEKSFVTTLGHLIMNELPKVFIMFICHLLEDLNIGLQIIYNSLKTSDDPTLSGNQILKSILEGILSKEIKCNNYDDHLPIENIHEKTAVLLSKELFHRVINDVPLKLQSFVQFGNRHSWLELLPPFNKSYSVSSSSSLPSTTVYSSDNVLYTSPTSQSNLQDLIELQSLLCSEHMSRDIAVSLNELLLVSEQNDMITPWLQLLLWPYLDKLMLATHLLLDRYPHVLIDYCKCFYTDELDLWKELLSELSLRIKANTNTNTAASIAANTVNTSGGKGGGKLVGNLADVTQLYKDTLFHVVKLTSPQEFFSLLPPNGSLQFFLPVIEKSCKLHKAKKIAADLKSEFCTDM